MSALDVCRWAESVIDSAAQGVKLCRSVGQMYLICQVGTTRCALPLAHVVETMRPLPVQAVRGGPEFILGASVIRGAATPVVDVAHLLFSTPGSPHRFVLMDVQARAVALAVDSVVGVVALIESTTDDLPPLLAPSLPSVQTLKALDAELMVVLSGGRLLPDELMLDPSERTS